MISSKQRAYLRGLANQIDTLFQIGKSGVTDAVIKQVDEALTARELVKIRTLDASPMSPREAAGQLAQETSSDVVQVIGTRIVLFRQNKKQPIIMLKE